MSQNRIVPSRAPGFRTLQNEIPAVLGHSTPAMALCCDADASSAAGTTVEMYRERIESLMMPDRRPSEGAR
jgi:hypothetical protein